MNVALRRGSRAEAMFVRAGVLVPGLPATPAHDLKFRGGKTIAKLAYRNFFLGGKASWNESDVTHINDTLAAAMHDPRLNGVMQQYFSEPITTTFLRSEFVSGKRPRLVTQASIEKTVKRLFKDGKLGQPDFDNTVFNFMLPSGTILTDDDPPAAGETHALDPEVPVEDDASSLAGLGGYHGSVHAPSVGGLKRIYYAVGVFSEQLADGDENGIVAFADPWKNVVATFYHELNEARTDPDVEDVIRGLADDTALGWTSEQGEECGDFPVFESGSHLSKVFVEVKLQNGSTAPVQLQYSNRDHGPAQS
jgi:hypothetical protein